MNPLDHVILSCGILRARGATCHVNSNSSGWHVAYVGGNNNDRSNAGLFQFIGNNDSSNSNSNIGSRLLVQWIYHCTDYSLPLGKNFTDRTGLSRFNLERP